jgi:hypothetical protein
MNIINTFSLSGAGVRSLYFDKTAGKLYLLQPSGHLRIYTRYVSKNSNYKISAFSCSPDYSTYTLVPATSYVYWRLSVQGGQLYLHDTTNSVNKVIGLFNANNNTISDLPTTYNAQSVLFDPQGNRAFYTTSVGLPGTTTNTLYEVRSFPSTYYQRLNFCF